ncbi:reverse transcriptase domain-containing protein [Tanacetum coccineum]
MAIMWFDSPRPPDHSLRESSSSTLKTLIGNKEKLSEMARTPLNENCSAVILNKLPKKLRDPGRFLIPCEISRINTCNALTDLGASINLMPYSVWKNISLLELTPTCMTLELADHSISEPIVSAVKVHRGGMVDGTGYLSLKGVHCSKFSCHRLVIVDIAKEGGSAVSLALLVRTYTVISYKVLQRRFTVGGRLKSKTTEDIISIEASWKFLKSHHLLALVQDSIHQQPNGPAQLEDKEKSMSAYSNDQGVGHTTVAAEILKAATRILAQEKHSLLLKNVITKKHPHEGWKRCQKVKIAQEDIGSQNQRGRSQALRMICPNHGLIKHLHNKIPKSVDEMMRVTTTFLRGEVAASSRKRKKLLPSWKQQEARQKQNFKKGGFRNQQRSERKQDRFTLLTKTPKEILALDNGKSKPPTPMTTPVEKRNASKFCEFHGEAKAAKKGETSGKDKPLAILMVQPWQRVAKQRITQTFSPETVISFPPLGEEDGTEGPIIIEAEMGGTFVHRMYVDGGSSSEILYEHCFNRFRPEIGDEEHSTSAWMDFMVVRSPSPYNGIIGRPGVRRIQAVPSTAHRMLKFPVTGGTVTLRSSRIIPLECTMVSRPGAQQPVIDQATEEKIQVAIHPEYPEQTVAIGSTLSEEGRKELCDLLRRNLDVFAWKPADMIGVPRHIAEHKLNIREGCLPVRQKKRGQAPERNKAIYEEVKKLVNADIMKEFHYHSWLLNPVLVKKHDDNWRMCVDFKDLNKACPKDGYPLPEIDWKVESLCGYPFKCFLDAYKGYHQIKMAKEDEKKVSIHYKLRNRIKKCRSSLSTFGR